MVRKRYYTDFFKNPRQLGKLLVRVNLEKYSSLLKEKEVLPRPIFREICGFVYQEPCQKHRAEYVRSFVRNNRLPMIEFLRNNDVNDEEAYEAIARRFRVLIDEWEAAGRSKSGKDPQPLKFSREVRGNEDEENNAGSEEREEEDAVIAGERVEDREHEALPDEGNNLTPAIEDQGDEEAATVKKQGTEGQKEQEGKRAGKTNEELNGYGDEPRTGERAEERADEILAGHNDENIEPPKKKRKKRRSPEEIAMEEYNKYCSPRYMKVAMNKK